MISRLTSLRSGKEAKSSNCLAKPVSTMGASGLRPIISETTTKISFLKDSFSSKGEHNFQMKSINLNCR